MRGRFDGFRPRRSPAAVSLRRSGRRSNRHLARRARAQVSSQAGAGDRRGLRSGRDAAVASTARHRPSAADCHEAEENAGRQLGTLQALPRRSDLAKRRLPPSRNVPNAVRASNTQPARPSAIGCTPADRIDASSRAPHTTTRRTSNEAPLGGRPARRRRPTAVSPNISRSERAGAARVYTSVPTPPKRSPSV